MRKKINKTVRKYIKTIVFDWYLYKFVFRVCLFFAILYIYLFHKEFLIQIMTHRFFYGIKNYGVNLLHLLWLIFMVMMIRHLVPKKLMTMAIRKREPEAYCENQNYSELELLHFVQDMNVRAWQVMLVWLCFNAIWGLLYCFKVIDNVDLLMLTVFYFLCDYICILLFCPFQSFIMKNKCCVNCRIYEWGHFMMFTPMLFIKNFFSWSLFFTSLVVLLHWELTYAKHPERFWSGSNDNLKCANCKDKTCQIKKRIAAKYPVLRVRKEFYE